LVVCSTITDRFGPPGACFYTSIYSPLVGWFWAENLDILYFLEILHIMFLHECTVLTIIRCTTNRYLYELTRYLDKDILANILYNSAEEFIRKTMFVKEKI
jgi:hypothetical protein